MPKSIDEAVVQSMALTGGSRDVLPSLKPQVDLLWGEAGGEVPIAPLGEGACRHLNLMEDPEVSRLVDELFKAANRAANSKLFGTISPEGRQV